VSVRRPSSRCERWERPRPARDGLAASGLLSRPRLPSPAPIRSRHPRQTLVVAARLRSSAFRARSETAQAPGGVRQPLPRQSLGRTNSRKQQVGAALRIAISRMAEINARRATRFTNAAGLSCARPERNTPCCPRKIDADGVSRCGWTRAEPHQLYAASADFTEAVDLFSFVQPSPTSRSEPPRRSGHQPTSPAKLTSLSDAELAGLLEGPARGGAAANGRARPCGKADPSWSVRSARPRPFWLA
jgi:hypothetical protein